MAEGSSPLTFRDSIRHLLPTAAAIALFVPLWTGDKFEVGGLVFASVLLGYVITTPLTAFLGWLYGFTPAVKALRQRRKWIASNWDLTELFYNRLTQEEKEYTYLTGAYVDFYRQLAFYLLIYTGANIFILIQAITAAPHMGVLQMVFGTTTPIAGGLKLPTVLLIIFSLVVSVYCFWDFVNEFTLLFLENGIYEKSAKKSHTEKGGLAPNVWGLVLHEKKRVPGIKIDLMSANGTVWDSTMTDDEGLFQFKDRFKDISTSGGKLKVTVNSKPIERTLEAGTNSIPFVTFELSQLDVQEERFGWGRFILSAFLLAGVWSLFFFEMDAFSGIDLLSSIPFVIFLLVFSTGHKAVFEDWKFSALSLTGLILSAMNFLHFLRDFVRTAPLDLTTTRFFHEWPKYVPSLLLVTVFFVISGLKVGWKIVEPKAADQ